MPLKKSFSLLGFSGKKVRSSSLDSGTSASASSSGNRRNSSPNPIPPIVEESEAEATGQISYAGNPPSYSVIFGEDETLSVIAEGTQLSATVESNSDARQEDSGNNIPSQVDSEETAPTTERSSNITHLNSTSFRAPETSAIPPSSLPSMEQVSPSVDTLSPHPDTTISAPPLSPPISPRALPPTPLIGSPGSRAIGDLVPPGPPPNPSQALRSFREAIIAGNIANVTRLIVLGTDVTSLPTLYLAAWHGHFDICKLLLSHNAPLEHKFDGDVSPLIAACYRGHLNIVKLLLRRGADVTEGSVAYGNCLSASCQSGSPDVVKQFLRKDRLVVHSLNAVWRDNGGPLHLACKNGNLEIAELLVAAGARIDLPAEPDKETPLCFACVKRLTNLNLISFLLDHQASIDGADSESSSPLGYACRAGNLSLAKLLLKRGANVNDHSHSRELPLYIACQERNLGLVELLLEYKADPNTKCKDRTPIEIAYELGHRDIIASLLQHGAILSPGSTVHLPVFERAVKDGDDVLQKLLRKGSTSTSSNSALLDPIQVPLPGPSSSPTIRPISFSSSSASPPIVLGFKPTSTSPPLPESLAGPSTSHISRPRRPTSAKALELLQGAVHVGNVVAAERLLTQGTDISLEPLLYAAALNGDLAMCELLLAHDTPLEQTQNGLTPLIVASLHGHIQVVQLLLKHGASIAAVSSSHGNCLNAACTSGNVELVRLLLWELNLDVNLCPSSVTMMPLCFACSLPESASSLDLVSLFLDKGADVNGRKGKTSPLGIACTENNVPLVKLLISSGADINEDLAFPRRDLPLQIACRKGNLALVKLLLEFGANPNAICSGPPPLRLACTQGQHDIVQCLLEKEARVDPTLLSEYEPVLLRAFQASTHRVDTVDGQPALIISTSPTVRRRASKPSFDMGSLREAVSAGNLATVQRLLSLATDISSEPLLCLAAWNGHISICEVLLEHHGPLEYKDDNDMTPLLAASVQGYTTIVQLLLDQGADAEYRSATHGSCIEAACRTGRPELVAPFLEREKIDLNATLGARDGPLHAACSAGHYALARLLVKHGADVNLPVGLEKKQPLFLACAAPEPNLDIIAFLLDKGADVQTASSPNSPLNEACFSGNIPLIELLLSRGAKINDKSRSQEFPLHIATVRGNLDLLRLLLRKGADPNEANGGDTALSLACRSEIALPNLEIVRCLLENGAKVLPHATAHTTAFERALQTGDTNLISLFLKQGAFSEDLLRKSCTKGDLKMVRTVLENAIAIPKSLLTNLLITIASPQENTVLVELLVRHGADVTAEHSGVTLLESACRKGSYDMIKCLLQVGAKLAPRSTSHIPIFEHALRDSDQSLVDLLFIWEQTPPVSYAPFSKKRMLKWLRRYSRKAPPLAEALQQSFFSKSAHPLYCPPAMILSLSSNDSFPWVLIPTSKALSIQLVPGVRFSSSNFYSHLGHNVIPFISGTLLCIWPALQDILKLSNFCSPKVRWLIVELLLRYMRLV
ncbi:ankyrin repeat-containing domain protein [Flagelloscypha sp. PMI_526]|nr:ankyrin repeat-containing domain protein [Flagelloscypha sp. PMI_526]